MRILITGAGGFVGRKLIELLLDDSAGHLITALDYKTDSIPNSHRVTAIAGDLRDQNVLEAAFVDGCDAVIHLATMPGGAAENNRETSRQVNVEATMALADMAAKIGTKPRFVFASSIAALGDPLPTHVDDTTPCCPVMLYGGHKTMMEQWLATLTRRGELAAISLRLSGIVARPIDSKSAVSNGASGMKSAFLSNVFHALKNDLPFVMPVSENATSWITSIDCAARNFAHAVTGNVDALPSTFTCTLPALRVRMKELVCEIAKQTSSNEQLVTYLPEPDLEASFGSYPSLSTDAAYALGFTNDADLSTLVRRALAKI